MRLANCISVLAMMTLVCNACTGSAVSSSEAVRSIQLPPTLKVPPTLDELKNATYSGFAEGPATVTLQDGMWTGQPSTPGAASRPIVEIAAGFRALGDLDADRLDEAVTVLTYRTGGSASFSYLAVMARQNGSVRNIATVALGDRVQLRSVQISGGKLLVRAVRGGADDAACCPGELVEWEWTLNGGRLTSPGAIRSGRLSLAVLANTDWVLRAWDITEPAGREPEVTLSYDSGHFSGMSGCNRYTAGVIEGKIPGELSVGLLAGTRMACPEMQASVESRFIEQLTGAQTFGFMLGRLAISYTRANGFHGTMLFDLKTPPK
jgi:heat shock protein HslJ